jgi:serine/threonine protein kinase
MSSPLLICLVWVVLDPYIKQSSMRVERQLLSRCSTFCVHGASKSFLAECEALRNIRHRNLVKILTVCSGVDYQGNDFKALVYEFMVNGSLEDWLHPSTIEDQAHQEQRNLNLYQRLNIAIDVASALEYLHYHCQTPILHCDLKPSNVLLDDEMIGHVGDFGLARFSPEDNHNSSTSQSSSIGIRGTIGYTPPGEDTLYHSSIIMFYFLFLLITFLSLKRIRKVYFSFYS